MACGFDALADLELQIEKSLYTPNTRIQIASEPRTEHFLIFTGLFIFLTLNIPFTFYLNFNSISSQEDLVSTCLILTFAR